MLSKVSSYSLSNKFQLTSKYELILWTNIIFDIDHLNLYHKDQCFPDAKKIKPYYFGDFFFLLRYRYTSIAWADVEKKLSRFPQELRDNSNTWNFGVSWFWGFFFCMYNAYVNTHKRLLNQVHFLNTAMFIIIHYHMINIYKFKVYKFNISVQFRQTPWSLYLS